MNENPYAAPEAAPEDRPVVPLAARKIRTVARTLRLLGWLGMTAYAICFFGSLGATIINILAGRKNEYTFQYLGMAALSAALFYFFSVFVRTARGILNQDPRAKRFAVVLSGFMVIGTPLFPLGIYFLFTLRKYYAEYCDLPEPVGF